MEIARKNVKRKGTESLKRTRRKLYYPKCWRKFARAIRLAIPYCQLCLVRNSNRNKLTVHHINYNTLDNRPGNLVVLCQKCHLQTQALGLPIPSYIRCHNEHVLIHLVREFGLFDYSIKYAPLQNYVIGNTNRRA